MKQYIFVRLKQMATLTPEQKQQIEQEVIEEYKRELKEKIEGEKKESTVQEQKLNVVSVPDTQKEEATTKQILMRVLVAGTAFMVFRFAMEILQRPSQKPQKEEEKEEEAEPPTEQ